jgi:multisubunit Na+/H+ antiporter MnhB subunit
LFLIGAISVIMLIIGGIRYTISGGDSGNVTAAKNTILYAIIGLVVAFLAFAIVNWVLGALAG